jgi:hypothetical protein
MIAFFCPGMNSPPMVMYLILGIMAESWLLVVVVSCLARSSRHKNYVNADVAMTMPARLFEENVDTRAVNSKKGMCAGREMLRGEHAEVACFLTAVVVNTAFVAVLLWVIMC